MANRRNLPYIALEDGFLRSLDLGLNGADPLSLVVDRIGIYYDATAPSALEVMLQNDGEIFGQLALDADRAMALIKRHRLSKYNAHPDRDLSALVPPGRRCVVVIDQTWGDSSVRCGLADQKSFALMLDAAVSENPDAVIIVKSHPDVAAGLKRGYLSHQKRDGLILYTEAVNPWSLLDIADHVYTVTSQMGFEALLAGKPVTCFGMPFYAGWGATDDRISCPRRTARRSPREIFAAAYLRYCRYLDPVTAEPCSIFDTIESLCRQQDQNELWRGRSVCVGFSRWKRPVLASFLKSTDGETVFADDRSAEAINGHRLVLWGAKHPAIEEAVRKRGGTVVRVEDGFVRSVGLGSDFAMPYSLIFDRTGIYFDATRSSDLEKILLHTDFDEGICARAAEARRRIVELGITKYNLSGKLPDIRAMTTKKIILVPGQVPSDASIRLGCSHVVDNLSLLRNVKNRNPEAFIIYKEHPDVSSGNRRGDAGGEQLRFFCDIMLRTGSMPDLLAMVDEVHTMTSLAGYEGLLRGKSVTCYGMPFYAGWGLTTDIHGGDAARRRTRVLTLDQLVAGAMLIYPRYRHWESGYPCELEAVLDHLASVQDGRAPIAVPRLLAGFRYARRMVRRSREWAAAQGSRIFRKSAKPSPDRLSGAN